MSFKGPKVAAGKVQVGELDLSKASLTQFTAAGLFTNPGVSIFGGSLQAGVIRAGVSIGPPVAIPGTTLPFSLEVSGISQYFGILNIFGNINQFGLKTAFGGSIKNGFSFKNAFNLKNAIDIGNAIDIKNGKELANGGIVTPSITVSGTCKAALGIFAKVAAPFKKFDIPHPSKPGMRLAHTCLEGPEIGVYYRGIITDENIIPFPDFWEKLVHFDTITVQLTPRGEYQELYYKVVENGIRVSNNRGTKIDCSYTVYAERCDVERLVIEYEEGEEQ
tara:strand:+ start:670 stop:1497 length:828 start_codon:yes stop_codon:yes gene_type:complete